MKTLVLLILGFSKVFALSTTTVGTSVDAWKSSVVVTTGSISAEPFKFTHTKGRKVSSYYYFNGAADDPGSYFKWSGVVSAKDPLPGSSGFLIRFSPQLWTAFSGSGGITSNYSFAYNFKAYMISAAFPSGTSEDTFDQLCASKWGQNVPVTRSVTMPARLDWNSTPIKTFNAPTYSISVTIYCKQTFINTTTSGTLTR